MAVLRQTFEGGTHGVEIDGTNSLTGGTSVTGVKGTGASVAFTSTAGEYITGAMAAKCYGPSGEAAYVNMNGSGTAGGLFAKFRLDAAPSQNTAIHIIRGTSKLAQVQLMSSGKLQFENSNGSRVYATPNALTFPGIYWIDLAVDSGSTTSNGKLKFAVYDIGGNFAGGMTNSQEWVDTNTGGGISISYFQCGKANSSTDTHDYIVDDMRAITGSYGFARPVSTAPTLVASYNSAYNTSTTPKTLSITSEPGDLLVVYGGAENGNGTLTTPSGNSVSFTLEESIVIDANWATNYVWSGTDTSGGTNWTLTCTSGGGHEWGFSCLVFRETDGAGASAKTNVSGAAPSLNLTSTQSDSALVTFTTDWNAIDGSSRTWRTINGLTPTSGNGMETTYSYSSGQYTVYGAYYSNVGIPGTDTLGLSAPAGQKYSIIGLEVKGAGIEQPSYVGYTSSSTTDGDYSFTVTPDTTCCTGMWMIATVAWIPSGGTELVTASGWDTLIPPTLTGTVYTQVLIKKRYSEDTSYTFNFATLYLYTASLTWLAGVADTGWIVGTLGTRAGSGGTTTTTAPGITTTTTKNYILTLATERTLAAETNISSVSGASSLYFVPENVNSTCTIFAAENAQSLPGLTADVSVVYPNTQASNGLAVQIGLPPAITSLPIPPSSPSISWFTA